MPPISQIIPNPKKKAPFYHWLLWWKIDEDVLKKQVAEYKTLKMTQSARGRSVLLLLLSIFVTTILSLFLRNVYSVVDIVLIAIVAYFMSKGHAWAAIAAMILWTVEKILPMAVFSHSYIASAIFWHIYMRSFYLAYHVEQERKKIIPEEISPRTFKSPPVQVIQ